MLNICRREIREVCGTKLIIIIIIYLLKDVTIKPARITVKRAGQQGVIIRTYKCPKLQLQENLVSK